MPESVPAQSIKRVTLSATPNVATQVSAPGGTRRIEVRFFDAAGTAYVVGKLAATGSDDTAIGSHYLTIGEGELYGVPWAGQSGSIYVASATASAIVEIAAWSA